MGVKRGRKKGQKVGEGAVQTFIKSKGGHEFLKDLYEKFGSGEIIAEYFFNKYNFWCSGQGIRLVMKYFKIPMNPAGGDRRSITAKEIYNTRKF